FCLLAQAANRVPNYIMVPEIPDYVGKKGYYDGLLNHPGGIDVVEGKFGWFNMPALARVAGALERADLQLKDRKRLGNWVAKNGGVANYVAVAFGCVGCTVPDSEK